MNDPVYIVGAGPGDPDLLTIKALSLLKEYAELVVYDRLIPEEILNLIPDNVEKFYAGKSCKEHSMTQEEINRELIEHSRLGKKIVRLKGGDPFVFGRSGEEAIALMENGIDFEIVPGISAASGISSYLGIPLTHRGSSTGVRFITGHQQKGSPVEHDWKGLANEDTTLVVYMGLANIGEIANNLIAAGLPENTPSAAIQEGTMKSEKKLHSTISNLAEQLKAKEFEAPTIIFIGKVVDVAKKLGKI